MSTAIRLLEDCVATRIMAWAGQDLPLKELEEALKKRNIRILDADLPSHPEERLARLRELSRVPVGLTGAAAGLAETGSIVVLSGPGRPRLASLLPPVHIALLPVRNLYPDMASFFAAFPDATWSSSNLVFITGPSRTADIELSLTLGVHGPKTLHVVLVPE